MVESLHVRRLGKRNRTNFYYLMLSMSKIMKYLKILTLVILSLDIVQKYEIILT